MRTFFAALACTATATFLDEENINTFRFWKWALQHGRNYLSDEELGHRFQVWMVTDAEIEKLNNQNLGSTHAHNKFSDWTREEMKKMMGELPEHNEDAEYTYLDVDTSSNGYGSLHWENKGKVTSIKDQGQCGSCWAFSSTAAMESAHAVAGNSLMDLSEQQLVDCADTCHGCDGGSHYRA
mmetsp:Transcript_66315/g.91821  ORF Transcript_66315/g.91821 Transcript_66315/m.91821 type:complete len:181 (+) Transcript_66315:39-581(+)|eukprot:CAMPEP_0176379766 /NCGR_PEP_ID=MMETSP0126-20121128/30598_1 /TAXON_ID=141414 ORGANISM="Strombidinopsis acuminatum, Strain SPMC142" /NCGR_SAMPLE_ID=MMETSP0126 /ASSEMBLY_ACC=CAM_ASM_000229 /LENGTH=180 /DNA_ID=CAMNT_0017742695 /DNA_START=28 /DNA_END=570 /DNA_ORIENTATION=+